MADGNIEVHAGQAQPAKPSPEQAAETTRVQEAVDFFTFAKSYYEVQLRAEEEDLAFEDDMWGADAREKRDEHTD